MLIIDWENLGSKGRYHDTELADTKTQTPCMPISHLKEFGGGAYQNRIMKWIYFKRLECSQVEPTR